MMQLKTLSCITLRQMSFSKHEIVVTSEDIGKFEREISYLLLTDQLFCLNASRLLMLVGDKFIMAL